MKMFTEAEIKAMDKVQRREFRRVLTETLDACMYDDSKNLWDKTYAQYCLLDNIEDAEYFEENLEAFKKYEAKMDTPEFDWDYYSDWHKDVYGFRPRRVNACESQNLYDLAADYGL